MPSAAGCCARCSRGLPACYASLEAPSRVGSLPVDCAVLSAWLLPSFVRSVTASSRTSASAVARSTRSPLPVGRSGHSGAQISNAACSVLAWIMRIVVLGAGPGGLYLAYLIKRRRRDAVVTVIEQNPADATFGFGVVFSDRALEFLRDDDEATYSAIVPHMESWNDITIVHRGERIAIDGVGFAAIGRLKLLQVLQARACSVGVEPLYGHPVKTIDELDQADLIVGADGVNSLVRRSREKQFGSSVRLLTNHFAWFGTTRRFDTLTQTFIETATGSFNAHHYRYAPDLSTFIVEVDQKTFDRAGFAQMSEAEARAQCERVFASALDGHPLISNNSIWRRFPIVHN